MYYTNNPLTPFEIAVCKRMLKVFNTENFEYLLPVDIKILLDIMDATGLTVPEALVAFLEQYEDRAKTLLD